LHSNDPGPLSDALAAELERNYFSRSGAAVLLIGKDGGRKVCDQRLDLPRLFERIDAPMIRHRSIPSRSTLSCWSTWISRLAGHGLPPCDR
jgi:hypothetical protein